MVGNLNPSTYYQEEHTMEDINHPSHHIYHPVMHQEGDGGGGEGDSSAMNALAAAAEARQSSQPSAQPQQQLNMPPLPHSEGKLVEPGQENTGRWSKVEHEAFLLGLQLYGREWRKVAELVQTRTVMQTRTHAQKYFLKVLKG